MSKPLVLLNPHAAGGKAARLLPELRQWLQQNAPDIDIAVPATAELARAHIRHLAARSRVVIVGGDGTLNQLLPAVRDGGHCLGLVPLGSGNDCARALKLLGTPWRQSLLHALNAPASSVDVGQARFDRLQGDGTSVAVTTLFLSSFTSGFDSSVGLRALNGPRWLRGMPRYLVATLRELIHLRDWPVQVSVDGQVVHDGPALFASSLNTPTFGSGMPAVPHARVDDGQLDLLLAGRFGLGATLVMLPRLLAGWHLSHPRVLTCPYRTLQITSRAPVPLAADGEYLGEASAVTVTVCPASLLVAQGPVQAATRVMWS